MICNKCFHFRPFGSFTAPLGDGFDAACTHPDCFKKFRRQNENGEIYYLDERTKDIINFVDDDDQCNNFQPFKTVKQKTFWFFYRTVKVPVET